MLVQSTRHKVRKVAVHRYVVFLVFAVLLGFAPADGQGQVALVSREAELKARMLVLLRKFVTWPAANAPSTANPLKIGIVGDDPFTDGNGFDHLQDGVPDARILRFNDAADIEDCHILVVARDADLKAALEKTGGRPILVVTESPGSAQQGSVINLAFDRNANKIQLQINPTTARRFNLVVNPNLLRSPLVQIVRPAG